MIQKTIDTFDLKNNPFYISAISTSSIDLGKVPENLFPNLKNSQTQTHNMNLLGKAEIQVLKKVGPITEDQYEQIKFYLNLHWKHLNQNFSSSHMQNRHLSYNSLLHFQDSHNTPLLLILLEVIYNL